jgi:hypothetical protein
MHAILKTPYRLAPNTRNELQPRAVPFSAEATTLFWEFSNATEEAMAPGKEYDAAIAAYRDFDLTELSGEDFMRGMQLAVYYATEAKRLFGANAGPSEPVHKLSPAQKLPLAQALLGFVQHWEKSTISARDIYTFGPSEIRDRDSAIALAEILIAHGHLVSVNSRQHNMKKWQIVRGPSP